jgi:uncharacterized membrane protein YfcA
MLTLLVEIALTIAAIKRGWKKSVAWLPIGITYFVCFVIGLAVGASGGSVEDVIGLVLLIELICIGVLIAMVVRAPHRQKATQLKEATTIKALQTDAVE